MKQILRKIGKGYLGLLKRLSVIFFYLSASLIVSIVLVLPFWALATNKPGTFSILAAVLFTALIAALIIVRVSSGEQKNRSSSGEKRRFTRAIILAGLFLFLVAGLYTLTLLIMRGLYGLVIPGALIYLFVLGYGFFASRISKKSA